MAKNKKKKKTREDFDTDAEYQEYKEKRRKRREAKKRKKAKAKAEAEKKAKEEVKEEVEEKKEEVPEAPTVSSPDSSGVEAPDISTGMSQSGKPKRGFRPDKRGFHLHPPELDDGAYVVLIENTESRSYERIVMNKPKWTVTESGKRVEVTPTPKARLSLAPGINYIPAETWKLFIPKPRDLQDKSNSQVVVNDLLLGRFVFVRVDRIEHLRDHSNYLARLTPQHAVKVLSGTSDADLLNKWLNAERQNYPVRQLVIAQLQNQLDRLATSGENVKSQSFVTSRV